MAYKNRGWNQHYASNLDTKAGFSKVIAIYMYVLNEFFADVCKMYKLFVSLSQQACMPQPFFESRNKLKK